MLYGAPCRLKRRGKPRVRIGELSYFDEPFRGERSRRGPEPGVTVAPLIEPADGYVALLHELLADELFLRLMIPHHQAAVPMAEAVLDETDRPAVEQLARAIVASQRAEIEVMQGMLRDMGAAPAEDKEPAAMDGMGMEGGHGE